MWNHIALFIGSDVDLTGAIYNNNNIALFSLDTM